MLTKIIKNKTGGEIVSFSMPEIGTAIKSEGTSKFAFPVFTSLEKPDEMHGGAASLTTVGDVLQNARDEAAAIVAQAEKDKEIIEQAAFEKGSLEAKATVETEIAERVAAQANELREELTATIEKISSMAGDIAERIEKDAVEMAIEIAKKIVGREVSLDREIVCTLVKIALGKLHHRSIAEVRLNPEDFAFVEANREKLGFRGALELVEDASISVGGCLIHTETGDIDARLESQFDEIAYGLLENK
ncbi:MAG: hypothetical protein LH614_02320 [Pyrinomonadaceae bacterium]|nr:hypothetical protein [Pyrinomonadaceae bacterium]